MEKTRISEETKKREAERYRPAFDALIKIVVDELDGEVNDDPRAEADYKINVSIFRYEGRGHELYRLNEHGLRLLAHDVARALVVKREADALIERVTPLIRLI